MAVEILRGFMTAEISRGLMTGLQVMKLCSKMFVIFSKCLCPIHARDGKWVCFCHILIISEAYMFIFSYIADNFAPIKQWIYVYIWTVVIAIVSHTGLRDRSGSMHHYRDIDTVCVRMSISTKQVWIFKCLKNWIAVVSVRRIALGITSTLLYPKHE